METAERTRKPTLATAFFGKQCVGDSSDPDEKWTSRPPVETSTIPKCEVLECMFIKMPSDPDLHSRQMRKILHRHSMCIQNLAKWKSRKLASLPPWWKYKFHFSTPQKSMAMVMRGLVSSSVLEQQKDHLPLSRWKSPISGWLLLISSQWWSSIQNCGAYHGAENGAKNCSDHILLKASLTIRLTFRKGLNLLRDTI